MTTPATTLDAQLFRLIDLATAGLPSAYSKRNYSSAIEKFLRWSKANKRPLTKSAVRDWMDSLGKAPATVNLHLAAVRRFVTEAADNGFLDHETAEAVRRIKGIPQHGVRTGNWLTLEQAERLINAPDPATAKGARDRALLGLLIGCGLRRSEVARLTWGDIQQRDGRWVIPDMTGKGGRLRTVPVPSWSKTLVTLWKAARHGSACDLATRMIFGEDDHLPIFTAIGKGDRLTGERLSPHAIYGTIRFYARRLDLGGLGPHDLRRTFAKLAHTGRAALDQIQLSLGHSSIQTTERYLGVKQNLHDAPCDKIDMRIE